MSFDKITKDSINGVIGILNSIGPDSTADILQKGKPAMVGEIREWSGKKYKKNLNGWVPVKDDEGDTKEKPKEEDDFKDIENIMNLLKIKKIPYELKDSSKTKELSIKELCNIVVTKPKYPSYGSSGGSGFMATSLFENEPVYVSILNSFKDTPKRKILFDKLDSIGLKEATGKRNAQWGTWKFAIRSSEDLKKTIKTIKTVY